MNRLELIERLSKCLKLESEALSKIDECENQRRKFKVHGMDRIASIYSGKIETLEKSLSKLETNILFLKNELKNN